MNTNFEKYAKNFLFAIIIACVFPVACMAQVASPVLLNAMELSQRVASETPATHVEVSPSPRSGSFTEGSVFEVPIVLNTKGASINGIDIHIDFDPDKLSIIRQSNGTSIINVWAEPPQYDNTTGTASYVGVIPSGITTESGFIGTITFKARGSGQTKVTISSNSRILLNDGLGTNTVLDSGTAIYDILPKPPEGVRVYSETHPFQDSWYNNNSPILSWDRSLSVDGFSYILDNKPGTIPDNIADSNDTATSFENLKDGLWYFHIKARKNGVWGTSGQFLMRIDATPPAIFKPEANYLMAVAVVVERTLVSFFTTDNLSGIDHYEVGVIDATQSTTASPVFVQSESPYQVPLTEGSKLTVMVRAVDKAGNIRDGSVNVTAPGLFGKYLQDNLISILLFIIIVGLCALIFHFLFGHRILKHLKRAFTIAKQEELTEEKKEPIKKQERKTETTVPSK